MKCRVFVYSVHSTGLNCSLTCVSLSYIYIYILIHINIYINIVFFIICPLLTSLYNIAVLIIICRFESTLLLNYANPCRNWTFQRFARQHRRKDATEQMNNLTLARTRTQVPGFSSVDALTTKLRVPVAEPEFLSL